MDVGMRTEESGRARLAGAVGDRLPLDAQLLVGHGDRRGHLLGHDVLPQPGPPTDSIMVRSEERMDVGMRTEESGRARLRKYVVTEQVTTTVPVSHEELRVEREPITDGTGEPGRGPGISEEEQEIVLYEQRPVVETVSVPVERIRIGKETVTEDEIVEGTIRKERVEQEDLGQ
jgi:uncharacterized protein (TIGR02271 family)